MTPRRLVVWILGAAIAIVLIATGVIGILTKAR
jgi:quinol-cytochrome oxidoreductase complex cytochrome b subunit